MHHVRLRAHLLARLLVELGLRHVVFEEVKTGDVQVQKSFQVL